MADFKVPMLPMAGPKPPAQNKEPKESKENDREPVKELKEPVKEPSKPGFKAGSKSYKSPAEYLADKGLPPVPYEAPDWSDLPPEGYYLEVLKQGSIVDKLKLEGKKFFVVGRLPTNDLPMEHPSLSR